MQLHVTAFDRKMTGQCTFLQMIKQRVLVGELTVLEDDIALGKSKTKIETYINADRQRRRHGNVVEDAFHTRTNLLRSHHREETLARATPTVE